MHFFHHTFLAALSSSRCLVVRPYVGRYTFVKKWPYEYQMVTWTYLPVYLCDSSDSCDSCDSYDSFDSSDSSDSSDRSDSSDSSDKCENSDKKMPLFFYQKI